MLISSCSVDDDYQSFETPRRNNYSVTASGAQIFLGYDDNQSFETPIINNHSVTTPSDQVLLGDDDAHLFEPPTSL